MYSVIGGLTLFLQEMRSLEEFIVSNNQIDEDISALGLEIGDF